MKVRSIHCMGGRRPSQEAMLHTFTSPGLRSILFGERCLGEALRGLVAQKAWARVLVVTSPSLLETRGFAVLREGLAGVELRVFSSTQAHVPEGMLPELEGVLTVFRPDAALSLGGGSAIDATKAVLVRGGHAVEHFAIPTTLSGAEFTSGFATTDRDGEKHVRLDPAACVAGVVLDPALGLETPRPLWLSTGLKSYADCIEAFCADRATTLTDRLALDGLSCLDTWLTQTAREPEDLEARLQCQLASFHALTALVNAGAGWIVALRHQLGARYGIPHGVASVGVMLPVLEHLERTRPERMACLARRIGLQAGALPSHCAELIKDFELTPNLRRYLGGEDLEPMVARLMRDPFIGAGDPDTVRALLARIA